VWWLSVKDQHSHIKRLVIYLDNGPNNSGTRTQCAVKRYKSSAGATPARQLGRSSR
jgi:hypothetical protein